MVPVWFLVVVWGLVGAEVLVDTTQEGAVIKITSTDEDVQVLVQRLESRVEILNSRVEILEQACEHRGSAQVAFAATLVAGREPTHQGPFNTSTTLVFKTVWTNIGNAYSEHTGVFTAPVRGLYYIRFTGCVGESGSINAAVLKNGENMFAIYDTKKTYSSSSNGMALVLEVGDRVQVELWNEQSIYDQGRLSTFSGFLVFPM